MVVTTFKGFDTCSAPSASTMAAWYPSPSPYFWLGVYIGGSNRGCSQPNLTASWVSQVTASQAWYLEPIWVGPQSACWSGPSTAPRISSNTATASSQGTAEAQAAVRALTSLGFSPGTDYNTPVVYDLEAFNGTSACRASAQAFIKAWNSYLGSTPRQASGVYGSTAGSYLSDYAGSPPPNFIWGALYDNNSDTNVLTPVPSNAWSHGQRLKQYQGGHNETHGGITLNIDTDSANGPVYGS